MENQYVCQSCSMPFSKEQIGTNEDKSLNEDYCVFCFKDGKFNQDMNLEQYIEFSLQFAKDAGMTEDEMKEYCQKRLPTLKRWK